MCVGVYRFVATARGVTKARGWQPSKHTRNLLLQLPHTNLTLHSKQGLAYAFCNSKLQTKSQKHIGSAVSWSLDDSCKTLFFVVTTTAATTTATTTVTTTIRQHSLWCCLLTSLSSPERAARRLTDTEAQSQPAYKQDAVSLLPQGWPQKPVGEQVRKWVRLLRLEETALHQDVKRCVCASHMTCSTTLQFGRL